MRVSASARRAGWWAALGGMAAVLLFPLLVVSVPPLLDYPNHLARMVVLAAGGRDPVLARMYAPHWGVIPDLATDVVGIALLRVLPPFVAGKLLLALVMAVPVAGMCCHHRALFGPRRWWPLAGGLVAANGTFLLGFLNFTVSLGAALLVAAGWCRWREERPGWAVAGTAAGSAAVFFCHLGGVMFLAVLLASTEAERLLPALRGRRWGVLGRDVARRGTALVLALAPAAALLAVAQVGREAPDPGWRTVPDKLLVLLLPLLNYSVAVDIGSAALLAAGLGWCRWRGWLRMPARTAIGFALLLALYGPMPDTMNGAAWVDARFPAMMGTLLFAGLDLRGVPRRIGRALALAVALLIVGRTAVVAAAWHGRERDLRALRACIAPVQPGARVLVVRARRTLNEAFWRHRAPWSRDVEGLSSNEFHTAALLLIERRAFWPLLFAIPSQQPLVVRPAYAAISAPGFPPPDFHALARATAADLKQAPYLRDWPQRFDWVLVLDAEAIGDPARFLRDRLRPVNDTGFAALFAVRGAGSPGQNRSAPPTR